jgi:FeS assembly SUF system protein
MEQHQLSSTEKTVIEAQLIEALRTCYDPEIPVNIYELGLIYGVELDDTGNVEIKMTLTSPYCPAIQTLPEEIESKLRNVTGVSDVHIRVVWDPPWDPSRMTEAAKLELGML